MNHKNCPNLVQKSYYDWMCSKSKQMIPKLESLSNQCHFEEKSEIIEPIHLDKPEQDVKKPINMVDCIGKGLIPKEGMPYGYSFSND